jgi:hypothetical protein
VSVSNDECLSSLRTAGVEEHVGDAMRRMLFKNEDKNAKRQYLVIHRDPGRYDMFVTTAADAKTCVIGRSMYVGLIVFFFCVLRNVVCLNVLRKSCHARYETSKISDNWVQPCNERVHKVWVPSEFNVETFAEAGVNRQQLDVVHEPLDTFRCTHHHNTHITLLC